MGSRLGRRVIHFANLPLKLLLPPPPLASVREFAVKTVPSASKVDIRRCLESLYGFDVAEVRTLNMEGKKLRRGFYLAAKPDYKKAYVTLRAPLSVSRDLFPVGAVLAERERKASAAAKRAGKVDGEAGGGGEMGGEAVRRHWLDDTREEYSVAGFGKVVYGNPGRERGRRRGVGKEREKGAGKEEEEEEEEAKFPWSGMRRVTTQKPRRKKMRYTGPKQKGIVLKKKLQKSAASTPPKRAKKGMEA